MKSLLIYYGWLNSFNSAENGWDNEKVAKNMAQYAVIVLGDGVANPSHGDFLNSQIIVPRIKEINPQVQIFGYVTANQDIALFSEKVDTLVNLPFDGVFLDECGYDFNVTRDQFNVRLNYVKTKTYRTCFVNAWNINHVLGVTDDPSFPNTTFNPMKVASNLEIGDWYLAESFLVNPTYPGGIALASTWKARADKIRSAKSTYRINIAASGIIANDNVNGQDLFNFSYHASLGYEFNAHGTSDLYYGASSATVKKWNEPEKVYWRTGSSVGFTQSSSLYIRNGQQQKRLNLNFPTTLSYISTY